MLNEKLNLKNYFFIIKYKSASESDWNKTVCVEVHYYNYYN